ASILPSGEKATCSTVFRCPFRVVISLACAPASLVARTTSHSFTVFPSLPVARSVPSEENTGELTSPLSPLSVARRRSLRVSQGGTARQSRTVSSLRPLVARVCPSGEKATYQACPRWPLKVCTALRVATFHSFTVLSSLPVASHLPSGENTTPLIGAV